MSLKQRLRDAGMTNRDRAVLGYWREGDSIIDLRLRMRRNGHYYDGIEIERSIARLHEYGFSPTPTKGAASDV